MKVSIIEYQQVNYWYLHYVVLIVLSVLEIMEVLCVISLACFKIYNYEEVSHAVVAFWMWWLIRSRIYLLMTVVAVEVEVVAVMVAVVLAVFDLLSYV